MLLVVDMQDAFKASRNVLDGVEAEVKKAVRNKEWIIFLEYFGDGPTHYRLKKAVKGYKRKSFVKKDADDGSWRLIRRMDRLQLFPPRIRVCGVNTNACVKKTVFGIAARLDTKLVILQDLCSASTKKWHNAGIRFMQKLKGVEFK